MKKLERFSYEEPYMELVLVEANEVVTLSVGDQGGDIEIWPGNSGV